ncbi:hypothetical protein CALCODRAFT_361754 [Calocera cornea HHB12733]|uniref:Uncharacterized protein n=1 Tax=Calocera cornea HHB12733 TaxID=1353952 RepID=A0A165ELJ7_9BASI|nr:hypothetical protein CALCODRAFT_361754 [Calocera cornea HHB12733]
MSTPHQAHNIPWHLLVSNLTFTRPSTQRPALKLAELAATRKPNQDSDVAHFSRRFAATIREFAATERAKYPVVIALKDLEDDKVLPDALLGEPFTHNETITLEHQTVEYWKSIPAQKTALDEGELADLVKTLYLPSAPHIDTLLFLAQLPEEPLHQLRHVTYSNFFHYGTDRVYQDALMAYILINVHISLGMYGEKFEPNSNYEHAVRFITESQDFNAHMAPQRAFFGMGNEQLQDISRLKTYLNGCFWQLYVCEMVLQEMDMRRANEEGRELRGLGWEREIATCLASMFAGLHRPEWEG